MSQDKKPKILGLIPARCGSKAIPQKNIAPLAGKPLISWVCQASLGCELIDEIILSSDSDEIIEVARSCGINAPFKRPKELARDDSLVVDVIYHALNWLKEEQGKTFDFVCLIQPTVPFAEAGDYRRAIAKAIEKDADTVVSVYPCEQQHPAIMYTLESDGRVDWFLKGSRNKMARRQDLPPVYMRSGIAYVFKSSLILDEKKLYGESMYAIEVSQERGMMDINTPFDLKLAEMLMLDRLKNSGDN